MTEMNSSDDPQLDSLRTAERLARLVRVLEDDPEGQKRACDRYAQSSSATGVLALLLLIEGGGRDIRGLALSSLEDGYPPAARLAARALLYADLVRVHAVDCLVRIGQPEDAKVLRNLLRDPDWMVRSSAVEGLGEVGGATETKRILGVALRDRHEVVRRDAVLALSPGMNDRLVSELRCIAESDPSALVRIAARVMLYRWGHFQIEQLFVSFEEWDDLARENLLNALEADFVRPDDVRFLFCRLRSIQEADPSRAVRETATQQLCAFGADSERSSD